MPTSYGVSYFDAVLKDADGQKTSYNGTFLKASRDENSEAELS